MKTFYDLTDEEKVVLTEEQVEYYTKLECAERGIIIPLKPIKEIKEIIQPTSKFYQVGYESFVFETEEDAQNYVDAKSKAFQISSIGNDYNSKNQYIKGRLEEHREIKTTTFYTNKESLDLKDTILHNSEAKKELEKYEKALEQSNNIRCDIGILFQILILKTQK